MSHARTIWEEGHEPGRQVVALGVAVSLSAAVVDVLVTDRIGILFDLVFAALCVVLALAVAPADLFTVGVLPPLLMLTVFALLALTRPTAIAHPDDGVVQAVISGLGTHSGALFVGYALCLGCLAMRRRVVGSRTPVPH
jgi:hypothetical protein